MVAQRIDYSEPPYAVLGLCLMGFVSGCMGLIYGWLIWG